MGITLAWDDEEKTVLRYDFEGSWTWEEMHVARAEAYALLDMVSYTVDNIINVEKSSLVPHGAITQFKRVMGDAHPRTGVIVIVGATPFMAGLFRMVSRITGAKLSHYLFARDVEHARLLIREMRRERDRHLGEDNSP